MRLIFLKNLFRLSPALRATGRRGFTLIESLIAVTVLTLAVIGPISLASMGLGSSSLAKDQLRASFFAQEGLEIVRSARDEARGETDWKGDSTTGWFAKCSGVSGCDVRPEAISIGDRIASCSSSGSVCSAIYFCPDSAIYGKVASCSGSMEETQFTRVIKTTIPAGSTNEVVVTSTVTWDFRGQEYKAEVSTSLFNR